MNKKIEIKSNCIVIKKMILTGFKFVDVKRLDSESFQDYLERSYFVVNNLKKGKYSLDELIDKSLLFNAIKVSKCTYSPQTMEEIEEMCKYAGVRIEK